MLHSVTWFKRPECDVEPFGHVIIRFGCEAKMAGVLIDAALRVLEEPAWKAMPEKSAQGLAETYARSLERSEHHAGTIDEQREWRNAAVCCSER